MGYKFLRSIFLVFALACLTVSSCGQGASVSQIPAQLSDEQQRLPENAIKGLQMEEGLYATLFASESMITNPKDIAFRKAYELFLMPTGLEKSMSED